LKRNNDLLTIGNGVNRYSTIYNIDKSEAYDSRNVSSKNYPSLSVRDGFSLSFDTGSSPLTTPNGMGVRNASTLHIVDGTVWKAWNGSAFVNVATGITNTSATILDFNREADTLTLLFNGTDKKAYNGTTVIDLTEAPATKLICIDDYRLYAIKNKRLFYSGVSDPTDFTSLDNSGVVTISGMKGTETALASYQDIVISWSDKTMHLLYGDRYDNFQLMDPMQVGCVSHRSVIEHNSKLYFMDYNKFQLFTGGFPVEVSQKVRKILEDINYTYKEKICSGSQGKYIYISIPYGNVTNNNLTLEFDTETGNWYLIDKGYLNFVNIGEELYGLATDGKIDKLNDGTTNRGTAISWYHETGIFNYALVSARNTLSEIWLEVYLPIGSTLAIYYKNDITTTFTKIQDITPNASVQKVHVVIPTNIMQNINRYQLKFQGTGICDIHFVELKERIRG
jgi:hypothetical protein